MNNDIEPSICGITYEDPDYEVINYIYKYHPFFEDEDGEEKIKNIYNEYGLAVLKNMLYVAKEAKKMRIHINDLKDELEKYEKYMNNFKEGKFTVNF